MLVFLTSRETEPPVVAHAERPVGLAIARPGVLAVAAALTMTGVILGANEVIAVAVADEAGRKGFSSVILALFAFGSMLAGIAFGTLVFRVTLTRRLLVAATAMVVLETPALVAGDLWMLALVMLVAGSATAPMLITSTTLTQKLVPPALVTEGMAVVVTGILVGISIGAAAGGWAIEAFGAQRAYAVPVAAGVVAVLAIGLRYLRIQRAELAGPAPRGRHRAPGPRPPVAPRPGERPGAGVLGARGGVRSTGRFREHPGAGVLGARGGVRCPGRFREHPGAGVLGARGGVRIPGRFREHRPGARRSDRRGGGVLRGVRAALFRSS